jgi:methyltransferase (TIGR00027 family)
MTAAAARAAHLIVDGDPPIFADTLAARLLGDQAEELVGFHRTHGTHIVLSGARTQVTARSRFAETRVAESVRRGVGQYVILGAGLDTFAYRSKLADQVHVFEVDHPATQQWKQESLSTADIRMPSRVSHVPVDFETDSLVDRLIHGGFDPSKPAIVSWLGVTMYLTRTAIGETLATIGGFASGTEIVLDYILPADMRDEAGQTYAELVMPVAAERGEPWLTFLTPQDVSTLLEESGFSSSENVRQRDAIEAPLWNRNDSLRPADLSMIARAAVPPSPPR